MKRVTGTARHGKLVDLSFGAPAPGGVARPARLGSLGGLDGDPAEVRAEDPPPALVVLEFDDGSTLELTDAGDWVSLGCWVVDDPAEVPAVAKLGPDPADPAFTRADFDGPSSVDASR